MAEKIKKPAELVDLVAETYGFEILDREAFTKLVNNLLISFLAPRLHLTELEQQGIISPKKASDDARGTRGVTTT